MISYQINLQSQCNFSKNPRISIGQSVYLLFSLVNLKKLSNLFIKEKIKNNQKGFPGGAVVESLPADAGDAGSSPGLGGSHMPRSD